MKEKPKEASKDKILVTGSSGLIGTRLTAALRQAGYPIIGVDRDVGVSDETVETIACDLTDGHAVQHMLKEVAETSSSRLAAVFHLAAYYDFSGRPSPLYQDLTVEGTRRLVDGLQAFDRVGTFVFSSSLLVHEALEDEESTIDERSDLRAEWPYPQSKIEAEDVLRTRRQEIPVVVQRLAGVYDEWCHSIPIAQQIKRIYEKDFESHFFPGDKDHGQNFVHIDDAVSALIATLSPRRPLEPFETFLVAENDLMTYGEIQDEIGRLLHDQEWLTLRIPKAVAKAGAWVVDSVTQEDQFIQPWMVDQADAHYRVDNSKVKAKLGWRPSRSLRSTIGSMIQNLLADPRQWYEANKLDAPNEWPPVNAAAVRRRANPPFRPHSP